MSISDILQQASPVLPVITLHQPELAVPLAESVIAGGLNVLEITLRTDGALDAISRIKCAFPTCCVGAGTVIHSNQLNNVKDSGADFIVTPGFYPELLQQARETSIPTLPGVATPGEIMQAISMGFDTLKLFPARILGGPATLKALAGPFPQTKFCPTGGISVADLASYLALPNVPCAGVSWLTPRQLIEAKDWSAITAQAKDFLAETSGING
ncbi:bifunctional 4-hydroxy-2-oxoglutarate aldolase/2-dehydro-3-deoxy-phosphogluconate aldolase [Endozoicomonadaceae bacterium StTr2]